MILGALQRTAHFVIRPLLFQPSLKHEYIPDQIAPVGSSQMFFPSFPNSVGIQKAFTFQAGLVD